MLQILLYLMAILTTVYSDCCAPNDLNCSKDDVDCHLKKYGIYCCNENVNINTGLFANDSVKIVRLFYYVWFLIYMSITFLQFGSIKDLEDHGSRPAGIIIRTISNATKELLLQNFTSICKRYTKVMAIKHQLQHHCCGLWNKYNLYMHV